MSAYLVEDKHINYLVNATALARGIGSQYGNFSYWDPAKGERVTVRDCREDRQRVGQMLWVENTRSVNYRYDENDDPPIYTYRPIVHHVFDPVQVLKSIACYEYQACEHPTWEDSPSHAFCKALRHSAINALPGYDACVWGAPDGAEGSGNVASIMDMIEDVTKGK